VRDARHLDSLYGCIIAARLAEGADAGPAALESGGGLARKIPSDSSSTSPRLDRPRSGASAVRPSRRRDRRGDGSPARSPVRRHATGEPVRPRGRISRRRARPDAAHASRGREAARELNESRPPMSTSTTPHVLRLGAHTLKMLLERFGGDGPPRFPDTTPARTDDALGQRLEEPAERCSAPSATRRPAHISAACCEPAAVSPGRAAGGDERRPAAPAGP